MHQNPSVVVAPQGSTLMRIYNVFVLGFVPGMLCSLVALFWALLFEYQIVGDSSFQFDTSSWTWLTAAIGIAFSVRASYAIERFTTATRNLTLAYQFFLHFIQYATSQTLRLPLAKAAPVQFETLPGGVLRMVQPLDVLYEIFVLARCVPYACRRAFASDGGSYDPGSRDIPIPTALLEELRVAEMRVEAFTTAIIRRVCFLVEVGIMHGTTGQVAFRSFNGFNGCLGMILGARRTFVPVAVRDILLTFMILYVVILPFSLIPIIGWYSLLFLFVVGAVFGGFLRATASVRSALFVDSNLEVRFLGVDTSSWASECERTISATFETLWAHAKAHSPPEVWDAFVAQWSVPLLFPARNQ